MKTPKGTQLLRLFRSDVHLFQISGELLHPICNQTEVNVKVKLYMRLIKRHAVTC